MPTTILTRILFFSFILVLTSCSTKQPEEEQEKVDEPSVQRFGGLALYTVRDAMKDDVKGTLEAVAAAGYSHVEAAGYEDGQYYGMAPEAFKSLLDSLNLTPISTHQSSITMEDADEQLAAARAAGFTYFVIPVPPMGLFEFSPDGMGMSGTVEELAEILTTLGTKANEKGLQLLYHNHNFEFIPNEDGVVPIDYLLENLDPELVNFQMDLYWVTKAGADPLSYFEKYPGRFKMWHVKDMDSEGRFAPVGTGEIDFGTILTQKELAGMEYYLVEQDRTFNMEPLEAIVVSHEGLEKFGFQ